MNETCNSWKSYDELIHGSTTEFKPGEERVGGVREGKDTGRKMRKENEKVSRNREY